MTVLLELAPGFRPALAVSSEEWVGKAVQATTQLSRGNPQGALAQAIPPVSRALPTRTQVRAGPGGAGISQPIPGLQGFRRGPVNMNGGYHAYVSPDGNGLPSARQQVRATASAGPFSNTLAFTPSSFSGSKEQ